MVILTRTEAGARLAMGLGPLVEQEPLVVVAVSPGGARVGAEVARCLEAPLDVMPAHRLEVPGRPRSVFGAIVNGSTVTDPERVAALGLPESYIEGLIRLGRGEVEGETRAWRGGVPPVALEGKTVIFTDDGACEALLVQAAVRAIRDLGARRVLFAAPVACAHVEAVLKGLVDAKVLLYDPTTPVEPLVRDPEFAQTTRLDVHNMVRRSRRDLAIPTPG